MKRSLEVSSSACDPTSNPTWSGSLALSEQHLRTTRKVQFCLVLLLIPALLAAWVVMSGMLSLDVIFTARAASMCIVPIIAVATFFPLLLRYPNAVRWRGFVVQWFVIALFFNLAWQVPQVVFKSGFAAAEHTRENLPIFIAWWGYATSDLDYGKLSQYFLVAEYSFWLANIFAIAGLLQLRRKGEFKVEIKAELKAFIYFIICAALQCYNVVYFFLYAGIVEGFNNIAADSPLAPILYWAFNGLWLVASGVACVLAVKYLLHLVGQQVVSHAEANLAKRK